MRTIVGTIMDLGITAIIIRPYGSWLPVHQAILASGF